MKSRPFGRRAGVHPCRGRVRISRRWRARFPPGRHRPRRPASDRCSGQRSSRARRTAPGHPDCPERWRKPWPSGCHPGKLAYCMFRGFRWRCDPRGRLARIVGPLTLYNARRKMSLHRADITSSYYSDEVNQAHQVPVRSFLCRDLAHDATK